MCLTIPGKIKLISGKTAVVEQNGKERNINLVLLNKVRIGDWLLILNDMAVEKITSSEANKIINLFNHEKCK